jgi:hypothetical protein
LRETSYRLEHIFNKSFLEGGITMLQLEALYEHIQEIKHREFSIQAAFHGVSIPSLKGDKPNRQAVENPKVPMFRDPKEYETMSEKERVEETQRMMDLHKRWSGDALNKTPVIK